MDYDFAAKSGLKTATNGQKIVKLSGYREDMKYPMLKQVEAYWQALRKGREVPMRSEVDPRGIERALEFAFVLERIAPGLARFRIAGQHLNDLMGMEVRGMPFTSFFTPVGRRTVSQVLENLFDGPETAEMSLTAERGIGKPAMEGKVLLLPLRSDLGDISRVLGCLITHGTLGRTPRRFELGEMNMTNIATQQQTLSITPEAQPGLAESRPAYTAARPNQTPRPNPAARATPGKRPALRLVKSDD